jgi:AcrR family transcriptional regulator
MKHDPSRAIKPEYLPQVHAARERRREAILAAAFEEFAANGYAGARMEDVARRAEIAKGTIYLYFKTKDLLFRSVLRGLVHNIFQQFESFVRGFPGTAVDLLRSILAQQYNAVVKNPQVRAMLRLLIAESHRFPELSDIYLREIVSPGMAAMRLLLEKGIASGEFRESRAVDFPQLLVGPAVLAIVWQLTVGDRQQIDLDAYREAHIDLVLRGLRAGTDTTSAAAESVPEGEGQ